MSTEPDTALTAAPDVTAEIHVTGNARERLLLAAATVLAERGYGQTRLGEVAALAGLKPPAIYHYFGSREDMIAEVMRVGQQRVRAHVEDAVSQVHGCALDRIDAAVAAHLEIQLELSEFAAAVTRNAGHTPGRVRAALKEESDAYHETWRRLIADARASGEMRADLDPTIARMLIIGALNWAVEWWTKGRPIDALASSAQRLVRQALSS